MKVLHVFKTYYPDTHGGTEQFIHQLATKTAELGVKNTIFTLSSRPHFPTSAPQEIKGVSVVQAKRTGVAFSLPWSFSGFWVFWRLARQHDVIHFHHAWPYADLLHILLSRRKPALTTYHLDLTRSDSVLALYRPLMKLFFAHLKKIVCTSQAYLNSSQELIPYKAQTEVVPIGIDETSYPVPEVSRIDMWRQRLGQQFVLFMGAFRYYKGLPDLIHASAMSQARLVILGAGPLEEKIHALVEQLGLSDRVQFVGAVNDQDKMAILSLSQAVVLPSSSRAEAFGISLLEGMMVGKALISTELHTGTSWVNQNEVTGYVVPPHSPRVLAEAMDAIVMHPDKTLEMGRAARLRFEECFTADKMAKAYLTIYRAMLEDSFEHKI